ncbi:MAG TPA: T9SS type A sorting domain-containing protein [Bacteroidia bacterium]|jgi:hypothetical protein|nr:T9SS type A sorting domain-containing protein [Bacteroidia bacterium]
MKIKTITKFLFVTAFLLCADFSFAQLDSIRYHDGSMESQWGSSTSANNFGCFVRITPPSYPATLRGIRGYFRNGDATSTIKWKVYGDPNSLANGGVGQIYLSPNAIANPSAGTTGQQHTAYVDLTASNIVITQGDVYVGAVQSVGWAGAGLDSSGNTAPNRQWQWQMQFSTNYWNTMTSQLAPLELGFTAFFTAFTTDVNGAYSDEMINVFPNPASNVLHVQLPSANNNPVVKIFDVMGKQIAEQKVSDVETNFDISAFAPGVYIVSIVTDKQVITRKIQKL